MGKGWAIQLLLLGQLVVYIINFPFHTTIQDWRSKSKIGKFETYRKKDTYELG